MEKIAVEEGFSIPEIMDAARVAAERAGTRGGRPPSQKFIALMRRMTDLGEGRIQAMDHDGITKALLLLSAPGVQMFDAVQGGELAALANDRLAAAIAANPDRLAGLTAVAPQDPTRAARELERGVKSLGLKGALINSHTHGEYLDDRKFWPIFEAAQSLNVPIYIHPRDPSPAMAKPLDIDGLRIGWGYGVEVGTHILRLIAAGVFEAFPQLRIVIGHMGEGIPFCLDRIDNRWQWEAFTFDTTPAIPKLPSVYFRENIIVTTSGMNYREPLMLAIAALGIDNVLFAADYPFEDAREAVEAMDAMPLSDSDKAKIYSANAKRVFGL